jgi:hypothetical protein
MIVTDMLQTLVPDRAKGWQRTCVPLALNLASVKSVARILFVGPIPVRLVAPEPFMPSTATLIWLAACPVGAVGGNMTTESVAMSGRL